MIALVPGDAYPWLLYLCVALFGGMIIPRTAWRSLI